MKVRDEVAHLKAETTVHQSSLREKRLIVERDDAVMELTQLKSKCKSLKERLKVTTNLIVLCLLVYMYLLLMCCCCCCCYVLVLLLQLVEETSHEELQSLQDQLKGTRDQLEEVRTHVRMYVRMWYMYTFTVHLCACVFYVDGNGGIIK